MRIMNSVSGNGDLGNALKNLLWQQCKKNKDSVLAILSAVTQELTLSSRGRVTQAILDVFAVAMDALLYPVQDLLVSETSAAAGAGAAVSATNDASSSSVVAISSDLIMDVRERIKDVTDLVFGKEFDSLDDIFVYNRWVAGTLSISGDGRTASCKEVSSEISNFYSPVCASKCTLKFTFQGELCDGFSVIIGPLSQFSSTKPLSLKESCGFQKSIASSSMLFYQNGKEISKCRMLRDKDVIQLSVDINTLTAVISVNDCEIVQVLKINLPKDFGFPFSSPVSTVLAIGGVIPKCAANVSFTLDVSRIMESPFTVVPSQSKVQVIQTKWDPKVGDSVRFKKVSPEELNALQFNFGGVSESMRAMLGQVGVVVSRSGSSYQVQHLGQTFLWNPELLEDPNPVVVSREPSTKTVLSRNGNRSLGLISSGFSVTSLSCAPTSVPIDTIVTRESNSSDFNGSRDDDLIFETNSSRLFAPVPPAITLAFDREIAFGELVLRTDKPETFYDLQISILNDCGVEVWSNTYFTSAADGTPESIFRIPIGSSKAPTAAAAGTGSPPRKILRTAANGVKGFKMVISRIRGNIPGKAFWNLRFSSLAVYAVLNSSSKQSHDTRIESFESTTAHHVEIPLLGPILKCAQLIGDIQSHSLESVESDSTSSVDLRLTLLEAGYELVQESIRIWDRILSASDDDIEFKSISEDRFDESKEDDLVGQSKKIEFHAGLDRILMDGISDSCRKVSLQIFLRIMTEMLDSVVEQFEFADLTNKSAYSQNEIDKLDNRCQCAMKIVRVMMQSRKFSGLVGPFFFRPLIARAGLKARMIAEIALLENGQVGANLSDPDASSFTMGQIIGVERVFERILNSLLAIEYFTSSLSHVVTEMSRWFLSRIRITISVCACGLVARELLTTGTGQGPAMVSVSGGRLTRMLSFTDEIKDIRGHLKRYLLQRDLSVAKFRSLRTLLGVIGSHSSITQLRKLEILWREIIGECLTELLAAVKITNISLQGHSFVETFASPSKPTEENKQLDAKEIVFALLQLLKRARGISQFELSDTNLCAMSADFAFEAAIRLLPPVASKNLSMLLAFRLSTLLDSSKRTLIQPVSWAQEVEDTTELIQVCCSCCSFCFIICILFRCIPSLLSFVVF